MALKEFLGLSDEEWDMYSTTVTGSRSQLLDQLADQLLQEEDQ